MPQKNSFNKIDYALIGFFFGSIMFNLPKEVYMFVSGIIIGRVTWILKTYLNID